MKKNILFASFLAAAFTCGTASATLIFSDNFNTANTSDLDTDLASRQSGTAATQSYATLGGTQEIFSNSLRLVGGGDGNAWVVYDFAADPNLLSGGAYKVTFDMSQNSTTGYAAFSMGATATPVSRPLIDLNTDIGLLMQNTGRVQVFHNNSSVFDNTNAVDGYSGFVPVEIVVTTDNFSSGTSFSFTLSINGQTVNLGAAGTGTWDGNGTNYMVFSNRHTTSGTGSSSFDNFTVTAIPEPSTLVLLGIFGLVAAIPGIRKKRG